MVTKTEKNSPFSGQFPWELTCRAGLCEYFFVFVFSGSNASRERKNETGAGVAQARPVIRPVFPPRRKC